MNTDDISTHYRRLLAEHGDTPQAVQYSSAQSQERRFEMLAGIGDLRHKRIFDFGCGTGQLGQYLQRQGIDCEYFGTDIVDEFLALCKNKFPQGKFEELNYFYGMQFDYIFICGVFNNKMASNKTFYEDTLRSLFPMCKEGVAFNMMSAYVDYQDSELFYEYPENVFGFIKREITPFVTLRNDYEVKPGVVPFDFTVYAYRSGQ
jgi:SAM-dependent methyltransferase